MAKPRKFPTVVVVLSEEGVERSFVLAPEDDAGAQERGHMLLAKIVRPLQEAFQPPAVPSAPDGWAHAQAEAAAVLTAAEIKNLKERMRPNTGSQGSCRL